MISARNLSYSLLIHALVVVGGVTFLNLVRHPIEKKDSPPFFEVVPIEEGRMLFTDLPDMVSVSYTPYEVCIPQPQALNSSVSSLQVPKDDALGAISLPTAFDVNDSLMPPAPVLEPTCKIVDSTPSMQVQEENAKPSTDNSPATPQPRPPTPIGSIRPAYPRSARLNGIEGKVSLEILVDVNGLVDSIRVLSSSGSELLDMAAKTAVQCAHFNPSVCNGITIPAPLKLEFDFKLKQPKP